MAVEQKNENEIYLIVWVRQNVKEKKSYTQKKRREKRRKKKENKRKKGGFMTIE